jgi:hypothetical protein
MPSPSSRLKICREPQRGIPSTAWLLCHYPAGVTLSLSDEEGTRKSSSPQGLRGESQVPPYALTLWYWPCYQRDVAFHAAAKTALGARLPDVVN